MRVPIDSARHFSRSALFAAFARLKVGLLAWWNRAVRSQARRGGRCKRRPHPAVAPTIHRKSVRKRSAAHPNAHFTQGKTPPRISAGFRSAWIVLDGKLAALLCFGSIADRFPRAPWAKSSGLRQNRAEAAGVRLARQPPGIDLWANVVRSLCGPLVASFLCSANTAYELSLLECRARWQLAQRGTHRIGDAARLRLQNCVLFKTQR